MTSMAYSGKYRHLVHPLGQRWVVAHRENDTWASNNTELHPMTRIVQASSLRDLIEHHTVRTYANINAAIKATLRLYDINRDQPLAATPRIMQAVDVYQERYGTQHEPLDASMDTTPSGADVSRSEVTDPDRH